MPDPEYEPIYQVECEVCATGPVVGIRTPAGRIASSGFCGPHFFGDRLMIDPERWNQTLEATE